MAALIANALGVAAAACSMGSFAPQLVKIIRERDASGVSLGMFVVTAVGFALWCAYGVALSAWPLVGSNAVCLVLSSAIAVAKLCFGDGKATPSARPSLR